MKVKSSPGVFAINYGRRNDIGVVWINAADSNGLAQKINIPIAITRKSNGIQYNHIAINCSIYRCLDGCILARDQENCSRR